MAAKYKYKLTPEAVRLITCGKVKIDDYFEELIDLDDIPGLRQYWESFVLDEMMEAAQMVCEMDIKDKHEREWKFFATVVDNMQYFWAGELQGEEFYVERYELGEYGWYSVYYPEYCDEDGNLRDDIYGSDEEDDGDLVEEGCSVKLHVVS